MAAPNRTSHARWLIALAGFTVLIATSAPESSFLQSTPQEVGAEAGATNLSLSIPRRMASRTEMSRLMLTVELPTLEPADIDASIGGLDGGVGAPELGSWTFAGETRPLAAGANRFFGLHDVCGRADPCEIRVLLELNQPADLSVQTVFQDKGDGSLFCGKGGGRYAEGTMAPSVNFEPAP